LSVVRNLGLCKPVHIVTGGGLRQAAHPSCIECSGLGEDGRRGKANHPLPILPLLLYALTLLSNAIVQPALHQYLVADASTPSELFQNRYHLTRQPNADRR